MENFDVVEDGATELKRTIWSFRFDGHVLILVAYATQTRTTKRHKWSGPFWSSMDERSYYSRLSRPEVIPADVLKKARDEALRIEPVTPIYIGWLNSHQRYPD